MPMRYRLIAIAALMLCMGLFCAPALAHGDAGSAPPDRLAVSTAWADGDLLRVEITDNETGAAASVELRMSDYAQNAETITIQAVDADGNASGTVTVTNPLYKPQTAPEPGGAVDAGESDAGTGGAAPPEPPTAGGSSPFTPDGVATVVDNVAERNGKEFFTITTDAGNDFFLVVDRHRDSENVYLLNTVTEQDLMALAEDGDGTAKGLISTPTPPPPAQAEQPPAEPPPERAPEPAPSGGNTGMVIFAVIAAAAAGGIGYYFKIVRPKQQAADTGDDNDDDYEYEEDATDEDADDEYSEGEGEDSE